MAMSMVERVSNLDRTFQRFIRGNRTPDQPVRNRFALEVLHHQKGKPFLLADVIHGANMRMVKRGDRTSLSREALATTRMICEFRRQDLDRHDSIEAGVAGVIHLPHAPGSKWAEHDVRADA